MDDKMLILNGDYLAGSGSTVITLKKEMMEQLSEGKHDVVISFDDGEVSTTLEIKVNEEKPDEPVDPTPVDPDTPETGDVNNLIYWFVMMLTSMAAAVWVVLRKRPYNR